MWNHESVWAAIDALAARHGLSASGLAKRAGLDPTSFNVSKRHAADGRPRWPSTESISKVLAATGESLENFVGLARSLEAKHGARFKPNGLLLEMAETRGSFYGQAAQKAAA